ncbi:sensor domain-containing diguanylate cyclase [Pseudoxanthomonas wuyuanensis]|nr:sensor domain-containing diguanylate cyclase [Pseudoxanthomonas wuyuanensis]
MSVNGEGVGRSVIKSRIPRRDLTGSGSANWHHRCAFGGEPARRVFTRADGRMDSAVPLRMRPHRVFQPIGDRGGARRLSLGEISDGGTIMSDMADEKPRKESPHGLRASRDFLERTLRAAGIGGWELDLESGQMVWSEETCRIHDVPANYQPSLEEALEFYEPQSRPVIAAAFEAGARDGTGWDLELQMRSRAGRQRCIRNVGKAEVVQGKDKLVGAIEDVTLKRQAIAAMEASERRFRKLFQYSMGLICTHDLDGVLLSVNPAAARSLGMPVSILVGRPLYDFMLPARRERFQQYLSEVSRNGTDSGIIELIAADGGVRYWKYHNVLDDEADEPYVLGHAQDVTTQFRQEQQLREWSVRDPLTSCFNRRVLSDIETKLQPGDRWGCIAVDLDHFKQVNDTYGHQRGDEVLVSMAWFLNEKLEKKDALIRLGGDEFLILLADADIERTESLIAGYRADADSAPIGFSMGGAARRPGHSLEQAIGEADKKLYEYRSQRRSSAM